MNLVGLDLTYAPKDKDKEQKATPEAAPSTPVPQALFTTDREFLFMLAVVFILSSVLVIVSGMAFAHIAKS
ncbi:MAG: hypothetical protein WCF26_02395 [Candidatus Sulfotelmatobacter sp.]